MSEEKILNDRIDIRLSEEDKQNFMERCVELSKQPQALLREMIVALNERRLKIQVTDNALKLHKELYENVDRK